MKYNNIIIVGWWWSFGYTDEKYLKHANLSLPLSRARSLSLSLKSTAIYLFVFVFFLRLFSKHRNRAENSKFFFFIFKSFGCCWCCCSRVGSLRKRRTKKEIDFISIQRVELSNGRRFRNPKVAYFGHFSFYFNFTIISSVSLSFFFFELYGCWCVTGRTIRERRRHILSRNKQQNDWWHTEKSGSKMNHVKCILYMSHVHSARVHQIWGEEKNTPTTTEYAIHTFKWVIIAILFFTPKFNCSLCQRQLNSPISFSLYTHIIGFSSLVFSS